MLWGLTIVYDFDHPSVTCNIEPTQTTTYCIPHVVALVYCLSLLQWLGQLIIDIPECLQWLWGTIYKHKLYNATSCILKLTLYVYFYMGDILSCEIGHGDILYNVYTIPGAIGASYPVSIH